MGLRHASVRHPNVIVMAPALTETTQSQNFRINKLPLALNKYKTCPLFKKDARELERMSNGVKANLGMNGHSPPKLTCSINGLAKSLKNEFIPIDKRENNKPGNSCEGKSTKSPFSKLEGSPYTLTQIGGFIMNNSSPTESTMGLQKSNKEISNSNKLIKDDLSSGEVDQIFKNLGLMGSEDMSSSGELRHQNVEEILQAITSLESHPGTDGEVSMFPISDGTDIFERDLLNVMSEEVMNMCVDDGLVTASKDALIKDRIEEFKKKEFELKRKADFLMRRLQKMKARSVGKEASAEITSILEKTASIMDPQKRTRCYNVPSDLPYDEVPGVKCETLGISLSTMSTAMKQLDSAATQQANNVSRMSSNRTCKYFGSGSTSSNNVVVAANGLKPNIPGTILPAFTPKMKQEMEQISGELRAHLSLIQSEIDSDVTASSTECESCDEFAVYPNQPQSQLSISKRALWKWAEERAMVAYKWTWLQAQMVDLDYKIRQHSEIRRQIRASKGAIRLQEDPQTTKVNNGLPMGEESGESVSSRTRPLVRSGLGKRKLVEISGLHKTNKKIAKSSTFRCTCRAPLPPCILCTGRSESAQSRDPYEVAPLHQRLAQQDPCFHPVLSFSTDTSQSLHYDAVLRCPEWQSKASRLPGKSATTTTSTSTSNLHQSPEGLSGSGISMRDSHSMGALSMDSGEPRRIKKHYMNHETTSPVPPLQRIKTTPPPPPPVSLSAFKKKLVKVGRRRKSAGFNIDRYRHRRKSHGDEHRSGMSSEEGTSEACGNTCDSSRFSPIPSSFPSKDSKDHFRRKRENSYDIDNIVIPYSVAASTRPEKLHYKEILTPKWRRISKEEESLENKNGLVRRSSHEAEVMGEEDISDESIIARHDRCEAEEKKKFLSYLKLPNSLRGPRGQKRTDSRAESSGANTPDPMSPATKDHEIGGENGPMASPPSTPLGLEGEASSSAPARRRTVSLTRPEACKSPLPQDVPEISPYELRSFPLSDDLFMKMLSENETDNQLYSIGSSSYKAYESHLQLQETSRPVTPSSVSTDSAESYLGDEDPNDPEWTMSHSTVDRLPNKR